MLGRLEAIRSRPAGVPALEWLRVAEGLANTLLSLGSRAHKKRTLPGAALLLRHLGHESHR